MPQYTIEFWNNSSDWQIWKVTFNEQVTAFPIMPGSEGSRIQQDFTADTMIGVAVEVDPTTFVTSLRYQAATDNWNIVSGDNPPNPSFVFTLSVSDPVVRLGCKLQD